MVKKSDKTTKKTSLKKRLLLVFGLGAWTVIGFYAAQFGVVGAVKVLQAIGVDFSGVNQALFGAVIAAVCYVVALVLVIGTPWVMAKRRTSAKEIGLHRLPLWSELGLAPAGMIAYFITSALVMYGVVQLFPDFNFNEAQEIGFKNLTYRYEYILAFFTLVVIAPVAEEMLFRGYLYGKLKKRIPWWSAALITSVLFGVAHGQWNVAVDTFVLGLFLCLLRDITGSLWPSIMLHMLKNGLAYYLLFVNPSLIQSIQ